MTETCQGIAVEKRNVKVDAVSVIKDIEKNNNVVDVDVMGMGGSMLN
jgi:stress response protein YsnF